MIEKITQLPNSHAQITPKNGILSKMLAVQRSARSVHKKGRNSFFGYDYFKLEDIIAMLNPLLNENGLLIFSSVNSVRWDEENRFAVVTTRHDIYDAETGDYLTFYYIATGKDEEGKKDRSKYGNKNEGTEEREAIPIGSKSVLKGITTATRYFYMGVFRIADNLDEESDDEQPVKKSESQGKPEQKKSELQEKPEQKKRFEYRITRQSPLPAKELRSEVLGLQNLYVDFLSTEQKTKLKETARERLATVFPDKDQQETFLYFLTGKSGGINKATVQTHWFLSQYLLRNENGKLPYVVPEEIANVTEYIDSLAK